MQTRTYLFSGMLALPHSVIAFVFMYVRTQLLIFQASAADDIALKYGFKNVLSRVSMFTFAMWVFVEVNSL
jgi:hypothetical protein